jgi:peptidyl-prolyl cis-trans isomerase A (cyclophilin A)
MMMTFKMRQGGWRFKRQDLIGGVALGLLNWWSTICFLRGLKAFDVTWFLPIYNVGVVVISALVGYFIFREGLRIRNWIGVALAVIAMIMIVFSNQDKNPEIIIKTELGDIKVALYKAAAPLTVSNFLKYVDEGAYKDITFYRVVRPDNTTNPVSIDVIQGGMDEKINVDSLPPIPHESTDKTGILHKDGVISMARYGPGTATSEFFICVGDQTELDSGGKRNPDGFGFAAFGKVTEGMDVVREIYKGETEGDFQRLVKPIRIIEIRRIK